MISILKSKSKSLSQKEEHDNSLRVNALHRARTPARRATLRAPGETFPSNQEGLTGSVREWPARERLNASGCAKFIIIPCVFGCEDPLMMATVLLVAQCPGGGLKFVRSDFLTPPLKCSRQYDF